MGTSKQYGAKFADYTARSLQPTSALVRERSRVQSSPAAPPALPENRELYQYLGIDLSWLERRYLGQLAWQGKALRRIGIGDTPGTATGRLTGSRPDFVIIDDPEPPRTRPSYMDTPQRPIVGYPHRIYRIEDALFHGMYTSGAWRQFGDDTSTPRHPTPHNDSGLVSEGYESFRAFHSEAMRFGYGSLEQLRSWVYQDDWRRALKAQGFSISIYEADEAIVGDTQAVFVMKGARRVGSVDIVTMKETM